MTTELLLGPVDLMGFPSGVSPFRIEALSTDNGTSWGNAEAIDVQMRSFLQHGALVVTEGWENRTLVIAVSAQGAIADDPAAAEGLLIGQLFKPNLVTYRPHSGTVRTVFPVLTSTLMPVDNDLAETHRAEISYQIKLTCRPFVRGEDLITIEALPTPDPDEDEVTETVEDITVGSEGWTGRAYYTKNGDPIPAMVSEVTEGVKLQFSDTYYLLDGAAAMVLAKSYPVVDTTLMIYMVIDWKVLAYYPVTGNPVVKLDNGFTASAVRTTVSPDEPSFNRSYFNIDATTEFATIEFRADLIYPASPGTKSLTLAKVAVTNKAEAVTSRQQLRRLDLVGTMPTTGSLEVSHETEALGEVLLYTCRGDSGSYNPACRAYIQPRTNPSSLDPDAVSGAYDILSTEDVVYLIPNSALPDGDYTILASLQRADNVTVQISGQAAAMMAGTQIGNPVVFADDVPFVGNTAEYRLTPIGDAHFPVLAASDGPLSQTEIRISGTFAFGAHFKLDDIFLLNLTTGQFTQLDCGTGEPAPGFPSNRVWIDSPDVGNSGQPQIWRGTAEDRSDAVGAWADAEAVDIHEFNPQVDVNTFLISTGTTTLPAVRFSYYPAYWYRAYPIPT